MKRLFYKWLYKRFYKRVLAAEKEARKKGYMGTVESCIRVQNLMNCLQDELTGGSS